MKYTTFSFSELGPVKGPSEGSFFDKEESIGRIWRAYNSLNENQHGIITLSEIRWEEGPRGNYPCFMVERGPYYDKVRDAIAKGLIWCSDLNGVDYEASISRWKSNLKQDIDYRTLDIIKSNDLDQPEFADFKVLLTLFMVSATRNQYGKLTRHPDFVID